MEKEIIKYEMTFEPFEFLPIVVKKEWWEEPKIIYVYPTLLAQ